MLDDSRTDASAARSDPQAAAVPDIEIAEDLCRYLREAGHIPMQETPQVRVLSGGVSNRTVLVERPDGAAWVIKQALPKLRVAVEWHCDPARIHNEALGIRWLERLAPAGSITPLVSEDPRNHLLIMRAVPQPHENWKTRLLARGPEAQYIRQFGELLGNIHREAWRLRETVATRFQDRSFFEALRLEPYYRFTATRHPDVAGFFAELIADTLATRLTLVHGDYSPKNILIHRDRLILLDHEVIHFGDPAFDLGFSLTHLLSKANHAATRRSEFLSAARCYWAVYREAAPVIADLPGLEARVVRHTLACLLARVDGRSPLEYLTPDARERQRRAVLRLMLEPPPTVERLVASIGLGLGPPGPE